MSTKFYVARHTTDVAKTASVANLKADTDDARATLRLLVKMNEAEPLRKGGWKISITNYDGSKTVNRNVNWKYLTMNLTAADVFSVLG